MANNVKNNENIGSDEASKEDEQWSMKDTYRQTVIDTEDTITLDEFEKRLEAFSQSGKNGEPSCDARGPRDGERGDPEGCIWYDMIGSVISGVVEVCDDDEIITTQWYWTHSGFNGDILDTPWGVLPDDCCNNYICTLISDHMEFRPDQELLVTTRKELVNEYVSLMGSLSSRYNPYTQQEYNDIVDRLVEVYGINRDDLDTPDNLYS